MKKKSKKLPRRQRVKVDFIYGGVTINGEQAELILPVDTTTGFLSRYCYRSRGIIVKFNSSYWRQSEKEIRLWKRLDEEDRPYFGQVLDWKDGRHGWVAMRYEEFRPAKKLSRKNEELLIYLVSKYNLRDIFLEFENNRGVRKSDNSLFIYDYGM